MTGETFLWYRVASHLKQTVGEIQDKLTFREFVEWVAFLDMELTAETKQDYYLAQIAAEVRRGQVKNPRSVKVRDFIVRVMTAAQSKAQQSKQAWATFLKVKLPKD